MEIIRRTLYLIPVTLGDSAISSVIPDANIGIIHSLSHFVVEEERSARRFLIRCNYPKKLEEVHFYLLNEHSDIKDLPPIFSESGKENLGLLSEAGVPGVADPGAAVVDLAHKMHLRVIPLTGPSSIILALMASGLNGQQFAFNGYLPVKNPERSAKIKFYEKRSEIEHQSQIFIEAPYRNNQLISSFLSDLKPSTRLCIAMNISLADEWIRTCTVKEWKKTVLPDMKKKPAVFILQG